jgi:hypothetical protein
MIIDMERFLVLGRWPSAVSPAVPVLGMTSENKVLLNIQFRRELSSYPNGLPYGFPAGSMRSSRRSFIADFGADEGIE